MPKSLKSISECCDSRYTSITNIYYNGSITDWCKIEFDLMGNPMRCVTNFYLLDENCEYQLLQDLEIPNAVTEIGSYQFNGYERLKKVVISSSVSSIGDRAFYNCKSLSSITFEAGSQLTSIGYESFSGCSNLISITIPNKVININSSAFAYCESLIEVCNKSSLSITMGGINGDIGYYAKHIITDEADTFLTNIDDFIFYDDGKDVCLFKYIGDSTKITLPNYKNKKFNIYSKAFCNCREITSIEISNNVLCIGDEAFKSCKSLVHIEIPNSITGIGEYVFSNCGNLESIALPCEIVSNGESKPIYFSKLGLPESLKTVVITSGTQIIESAFYGCSSITTIVMPNSVKSIGYGAFHRCDNLSTIYYRGTVEDWNKISIIYINSNPLEDVTIYYYSETAPIEEGNFWCYDENGNIKIW